MNGVPPDIQEAFVEFMKVINHPHQWYGGRTYAQHGDDLAILNLFKCLRIERPSYIDIGAHHPFHLSNTALLYARGSRGINVEANPALLDNFKRLRPEDINVCAAVVDHPNVKRVVLNRINETSGVNSLLRIDEKLYGKLMDSVEVPSCTLTEVMNEYAGGSWPDLLSIDVEGMDIPILSTTDFTRDGPKVICAEFVSQSGDVCAQLRGMMTSRGYTVHSFCGSNMLLVRTDMVDMCR